MTVFKVGLAQARKSIIRALMKKRVAMLKSSPGLGKSALIKSIAKEYKLKIIDLRTSQSAQEDFNGLPMRTGDKATYAAFDTFPLEGDPVPKGYAGWLIFMDEFNSGSKSVQAASYKLVLDKLIGTKKLHPKVAIVCAGNLESDKAIVNRLGTAMQSRLIHYELDVIADEYLEIFGQLDFDYRILGFLEWKKDLIHKFDPNHNEHTFPCPRTWEFASDMIKGVPDDEIFLGDVAGCVGDGAAVEFSAFMKEYGKLPTYAAVISDPSTTEVPHESGTKFAMLSVLLNGELKDDFKPIMTYLGRYPQEFQMIFLRSVVRKYPEMMRDPEVIKHRSALVKFATGRGVSSNAMAA